MTDSNLAGPVATQGLDHDGLAVLVDRGPFGLVVSDAHGLIQWINETMSGWLGYAGEELIGKRTLQELLTPGGRIYYETHVRPLLHIQSEVRELALEVLHCDGSRRSVLVNSRLRDGTASGQHIVDTVVFDATNRRSYEAELLRERRLAEKAEARLQVMYDVASGLAAAITVEDIVAVVSQQGSASIAGGRCSVWMVDLGRSAVRLGAGPDDPGPIEVVIPQQAPALERLARGELVVIGDRVSKRDEFPVLCEWMEDTSVESAVIAPLRIDGVLKGVISYGFADAHDFDDAELAAASTLAIQTEQAIRRAGLVASERRGRHRVEALLEFTTQLSGALTLEDVFDAVADGSRTLLGATGFRLALMDETRRYADFVRGSGVGGRLGLRIPLEGRSIGCAAMRTGHVHAAGDRNELLERFPDSPILSEPEFGRVVSVPLRRGEEVVGAWVLAFADSGQPEPDDLTLMAMFGAQAGEVIQRAGLYDAENAGRVQADLRSAMSEALNRAVTTTDVAQAITHEGRRAFDAAGLAVFVVDLHDPMLLRVESTSGLNPAVVASTAVIDEVCNTAGLSEWTSPAFVTGRAEVAAVLDAVVQGVDWHAVVLMPLGLSGRELGLIAIGFERAGALSSVSRVALTALAAEASVALGRARRFDVHHDAAITLQRSLLPDIAPLSDGWSVSTWYEPGGELVVVGGDLFDVTELDDGRVVVVVGDVVGHGLEAAASMGLLRSAAKTLALVRSRPADVISGLQAFASVTPGVRYSSICCVEVRPDGRSRYASAGHPFPVLRQADGRTELLEGGRSPLLGITAAPPSEAEVHVAVGSTLVVYTDGLIDRRGTTTDLEVDRLRNFVGGASFPLTTARQVVENMLGESPTHDDIVVVCLSRTDTAPAR